jgi:hypothetical protein
MPPEPMSDTAENHKAIEGTKWNECTVLHSFTVQRLQLLVICIWQEAKQWKLDCHKFEGAEKIEWYHCCIYIWYIKVYVPSGDLKISLPAANNPVAVCQPE